MPEDNERSIKARRISHLRKQMRKRATVSSGDTSGKPGSGSAEQPGWQRQLSAIRQSLRANTELGAATVDQETIRKSQDEALDALEALAERQRSEEQERRLFMHQMLDYVEAAEQHAISDEDVEQTLAQFPEDNYILAEDFTTWSETIYADLQAEQSETMQIVANALALLAEAERFGAKLPDMAAKDAMKDMLDGPLKTLRANAIRLKLVDDSGDPLGSALVRGEALAARITDIRDSLTDKAHSDHHGPIRAAMETTINQLQIRASLAVKGSEDYIERAEEHAPGPNVTRDGDGSPEPLGEIEEAAGDEPPEQEQLLQRGRRARQGIRQRTAELRVLCDIDSPHQLAWRWAPKCRIK